MVYWEEVTDIVRDRDRVHQPGSVLVYAFTASGDLLWVRHPRRGWELPGGKMEAGETPAETVQREVWEEAGAKLDHVRWTAEYSIHLDPAVLSYKWVYFASVVEMSERPSDSEIVDVRIAPPVPPEEIVIDPAFSPVLKDAVYRNLWPDVEAQVQRKKGSL